MGISRDDLPVYIERSPRPVRAIQVTASTIGNIAAMLGNFTVRVPTIYEQYPDEEVSNWWLTSLDGLEHYDISLNDWIVFTGTDGDWFVAMTDQFHKLYEYLPELLPNK